MIQNPLIDSFPILQRTFAKMSPEGISSFSDEQIILLHHALSSNQPRRHSIDIRLSIPLIRMYFVILGGKELRSRKRLHQDRKIHRIWTITNLIFMTLMFLGMTSMGVGLFMLMLWN